MLQPCSRLGGEGLQDISLVVGGPPEVVPLAVDLDELLVEMPASGSGVAHRLYTFAADLAGEQGAEAVPPEPHRFMANVNAAFGQKVFDLTQ